VVRHVRDGGGDPAAPAGGLGAFAAALLAAIFLLLPWDVAWASRRDGFRAKLTRFRLLAGLAGIVAIAAGLGTVALAWTVLAEEPVVIAAITNCVLLQHVVMMVQLVRLLERRWMTPPPEPSA
jgi:hypothetical protein